MKLEIADYESTPLHISHLYRHVSAYELSKETVDDLSEMLKGALVEASEKRQTQIVDMDGDMCFHVTPAGYIRLMIPWKTFQVVGDNNT